MALESLSAYDVSPGRRRGIGASTRDSTHPSALDEVLRPYLGGDLHQHLRAVMQAALLQQQQQSNAEIGLHLEWIAALLDRVARAGFRTLVVTVDIPISANRENNIRTGFSTPLRPSLRLAWDGLVRPRWLVGTFARTLLCHGMPHFENSFATRGAPIVSSSVLRDFSARDHLSWDHLRAIRHRWKGPLVIKGILSVDDALHAQRMGADAVVLSNHGGRQLDGAASAMRVLEAVVAAVGPSYPVLIDGGFRRGSDVLKAIALGARMVLVGRPFNYAAAVAGEAGVTHAIGLLRDEIDRNMAMLGVTSCAALGAHQLMRRHG